MKIKSIAVSLSVLMVLNSATWAETPVAQVVSVNAEEEAKADAKVDALEAKWDEGASSEVCIFVTQYFYEQKKQLEEIVSAQHESKDKAEIQESKYKAQTTRAIQSKSIAAQPASPTQAQEKQDQQLLIEGKKERLIRLYNLLDECQSQAAEDLDALTAEVVES